MDVLRTAALAATPLTAGKLPPAQSAAERKDRYQQAKQQLTTLQARLLGSRSSRGGGDGDRAGLPVAVGRVPTTGRRSTCASWDRALLFLLRSSGRGGWRSHQRRPPACLALPCPALPSCLPCPALSCLVLSYPPACPALSCLTLLLALPCPVLPCLLSIDRPDRDFAGIGTRMFAHMSAVRCRRCVPP